MITINIEDIYPGLLIFLRATGLFLVMPVFSGNMIPSTVRIAIAAILAYLTTFISNFFCNKPIFKVRNKSLKCFRFLQNAWLNF